MTTLRLLWTVDESAEILGVSRSTIYRLINRGRLTPIKVGASTRIPAQTLERFVTDELDRAQRSQR